MGVAGGDIAGWTLWQPPRVHQPGGGTRDGVLLGLPLIIGAKWEESGISFLRNPGAQLGLGGPWGPTQFWWICPFLAGCPAPASVTWKLV